MNKEEILQKIGNVLNILNQVTVTGIQNCTAIGAACAELEKIGQNLHDNIEQEKQDNQNKEG